MVAGKVNVGSLILFLLCQLLKVENYFLAKKKKNIYIYTKFSFRIMVKLKFLIKTFDEKNLL